MTYANEWIALDFQEDEKSKFSDEYAMPPFLTSES